MHAQTVAAADWWARPASGRPANWIATYQNSLKARHRDAIAEIVAELKPETLLEVGCHCGPNLVRLADEHPTLEMIGLDVNADAIQAGRVWVANRKLADRVQLNAGRVPDATSALPSQAFDVVLSCYALAYIAPTDLDATLHEMGRLAAKAIVLAEPMTTRESAEWSGSLNGYQEWAHNYAAAKRWLNTWRGMSTRIVPVDPPVDRLASILVAVRA